MILVFHRIEDIEAAFYGRMIFVFHYIEGRERDHFFLPICFGRLIFVLINMLGIFFVYIDNVESFCFDEHGKF